MPQGVVGMAVSSHSLRHLAAIRRRRQALADYPCRVFPWCKRLLGRYKPYTLTPAVALPDHPSPTDPHSLIRPARGLHPGIVQQTKDRRSAATPPHRDNSDTPRTNHTCADYAARKLYGPSRAPFLQQPRRQLPEDRVRPRATLALRGRIDHMALRLNQFPDVLVNRPRGQEVITRHAIRLTDPV